MRIPGQRALLAYAQLRSNPLRRLDVPDRANAWETTRIFCVDIEMRLNRLAELRARILVLHLQGHTITSTAHQVNRCERTVSRILNSFYPEWP